ncbi:MAG TPA: translesion DNA synthesis-associated protein ImuA [Comamonadaceae bacterium]|nr:translesion DNA synthesis-associated protein ImuA [Comamonadaceae bacterium]
MPYHWPAMTSSATVFNTLPRSVAAAVWRADQLGTVAHATLSSGFDVLDAALPGGGWPCRGLTELLCSQAGVLEWRLLGPALRAQQAGPQGPLVLVAPPWVPHVPGLRSLGIDERRLVWIDARSSAERVWVVEQLLRAHPVGSVLAWLPDVRAVQLRKLQVLAGQAGVEHGPVFVFRDGPAALDASPVPLRVRVRPGPGLMLQVELLKRPGAPLDRVLTLMAEPPGLAGWLPSPRSASSVILPETADVVGRSAVIRSRTVQRPVAH